MCILSVKRQANSIIAAFNRDEKKNALFKTIGNHWSSFSEIKGYLDETSKGTFLAWNQSMIGFLLNREKLFNEVYRTSRGAIILDILSSCHSIDKAADFCHEYKFENYAPFNLISIDTSFKVYYISNRNSLGQKAIEQFYVPQNFFMLNRSYINDFTQTRIHSNYKEMSCLLDSYPDTSTMLSSFLLKESYCHKQCDEKSMFLYSDEWCTRSSTIIIIQDGNITSQVIYEK